MLGLRTFYILIATQIMSMIGSHMTGVAVGIWVFQETGKAGPLLIAAFFAELPGMVMGSLTGILVDRLDRRHVIILGDAGQALGTVLLLVSFASGHFQLWHLYAVMLIQGIFATLQTPASNAVITMLVPDTHRDRANGLREIGFPLAGVIAPPLAGIAYEVIGLAGVIAIDLLTFVLAVVVVALLTIPHLEESIEGRTGSLWRDMIGGWTFITRRRYLLLVMIYVSFVEFIINGPLEMNIPYLTTLVGDGIVLGLLLGTLNLGAFAGAMTIAIKGSVRHRVRVIIGGFVMLGLMIVFYGVARHPVLLGLAGFCVMFPLPFNGALLTSVLQAKTPPDLQGRVFAVTWQMRMFATPFSFLLTAWLVDEVLEPAANTPGDGMGLLLVSVGTIIVVVTGLVFAVPGVRRLEHDLPDYVALTAESEDQSEA